MDSVKPRSGARCRHLAGAAAAAALAMGLLSAPLGTGAGCLPARRALPELVRGIVLPLHDLDARRSYREAVREIRATGANAISIMPTWDMADVRAPRVSPGSATVAQIEDALTAAREAGLAVLVAPTLRLEHLAPGEWRGTLAPPDWDVWFESYRSLLLDLARTAERHRAEALLVGSELCSSERFERRWRDLIADVRAVFHGSLTYQANWDHRQVPAFLDALDVLGTNAYFELVREGEEPVVSELVAAWAPFRESLLAWAAEQGQPLLITEVGYASLSGTAAWPWDYTRTAPVDLEAQRRAYQALCQVWLRGADAGPPGERRFLGLFLYEWWGEGGTGDGGYTPRGKPALEVLRRCFAGDAAG